MSALCQKQTLRGGLFDNLIRFGGEIGRDLDAKRLSGLEVDDRLKFARLNHRDRHFAWQQSLGSNVRFGSKADIQPCLSDVRFTPMCGRLRVGKENLHVAGLVGAAMCSACLRGSHDRWP